MFDGHGAETVFLQDLHKGLQAQRDGSWKIDVMSGQGGSDRCHQRPDFLATASAVASPMIVLHGRRQVRAVLMEPETRIAVSSSCWIPL